MLILKKLLLLIIFCGVSNYLFSQELYKDENGVEVFYEIIKTDQITQCSRSQTRKENFSDNQIQIWKIKLSIKNGHDDVIIPRGNGIANISVHPSPLKPYVSDYCSYKTVKNYEPSKGWLGQSLFAWPIREFKVKEIRSGATLTNTTYLYLYKGQKPTLTNSEFLGYQLQQPLNSHDSSLNSEAKSSISKEKLSNDIKVSQELLSNSNDKKVNLDKKDGLENKVKDSASNRSLKQVDDTDTVHVIIDEKVDKNTVIENREEEEEEEEEEECPGTKAIEFRNKIASSTLEQRAYSRMSLYYTYKCECEHGTNRSNDLIAMINSIVDSYITNTNSAYGIISKVSKCKTN